MSLRAKVLLAQMPLVVAVAAIGMLAASNIASLGRHSARILDENYRSVLAAQRMRESIERLEDAFDGDGSILVLLADSYAGRNPDGSYRGNVLEAFPTISCLDHPSNTPVDQVESHVPELEKLSPTFGRTFAWAMTMCNDFTTKAAEVRRPLHGEGAAPIVVIGTTRDPATPQECHAHERD